jgi:hypothetical protein
MHLFAVACNVSFFRITVFCFVYLAAYYWGDEIKEVKMDGVCDTYGIGFRYDCTWSTKEQNGG